MFYGDRVTSTILPSLGYRVFGQTILRRRRRRAVAVGSFLFSFFYEYYPFSGRFSRYLGRIYVIGLAVSIFIEFDWL